MPFDGSKESATATTAPQDVSREDAATFDVLRKMREDILCCVLKPDQRLRFGELRQRYGTSVGTLREALSHL
ncbi:MAG: GntR family transcriptional regulator, partial [Rhodospirillales bacterium]|nr:GntR family transcriptional regulator [Rhodospirillales bacterium]